MEALNSKNKNIKGDGSPVDGGDYFSWKKFET